MATAVIDLGGGLAVSRAACAADGSFAGSKVEVRLWPGVPGGCWRLVWAASGLTGRAAAGGLGHGSG